MQGHLRIHLPRRRRHLQELTRGLPPRLPRISRTKKQQNHRKGTRYPHWKIDQLSSTSQKDRRLALRISLIIPPAHICQANTRSTWTALTQTENNYQHLPQFKHEKLNRGVAERTRKGSQWAACRVGLILAVAERREGEERGSESKKGVECETIDNKVKSNSQSSKISSLCRWRSHSWLKIEDKKQEGKRLKIVVDQRGSSKSDCDKSDKETCAKAAFFQQNHQRRANHKLLLLQQVQRCQTVVPRIIKRFPCQQIPLKMQRNSKHTHHPAYIIW